MDPDCGTPACWFEGVGETIGGTFNFWSDPFGNLFKTLKEAAAGLVKDVLPALTTATLPDLTTEWFVSTYAVSFATAIFVGVILVIVQLVRTARGQAAGRDTADSIGLFFPLFLIGAMFGPMFGILLVQFFHALSEVFVAWGIGGSNDQIIQTLGAIIQFADPAAISGGIVVAAGLMLCMVIGLFLVVLVLIVQLVTLYFTGVMIPLGLVWIIDNTKRNFGLRLLWLWLGILAAHPLLFLLLGFAFKMMAGNLVNFGQSAPLQALVNFVVALLALFIATLSPLLLLKFAPVLPMGSGGTDGPSLSNKTIGSPDLSDATRRYKGNPQQDQWRPSTPPADYDDAPPRAAGDPDGSGLAGAADRASQNPGGSGTGTPKPAPAAAPAGAGTAAGEGAGIGAGALGGAAAAEGAGAGAAAGSAAGGVAVAGAAESATGAGAVIGVPTLIAAAAVGAAEGARKVGEAGADMATSAVDDLGSDNGGN